MCIYHVLRCKFLSVILYSAVFEHVYLNFMYVINNLILCEFRDFVYMECKPNKPYFLSFY